MNSDDLTPWQDTPLVQALTAPGRDDEVAGQQAALAAFRTAQPARRRRSVARFLGTGMTSVALLGAVGGGVAAAAYTRSLPAPVQSVFHDMLGPIGIPAPHRAHHHKPAGTVAAAAHAVAPVTSPSASATAHVAVTTGASGAPSASPPTAGRQPAAPAGGGVVPSGSPSPGPQTTVSPTPSPAVSTTPTPTPSPTSTASDPSTWTLSAAASRRVVPVHQGVQVSGELVDASGQPVAGHAVVVRVHIPGTPGWQRAAVRRTAADGTVQAWLGDLTENRVVVLGAGHGVHSSRLRIVVKPVVTVSVAQSADGASYIVTVSADGGDAGDVVQLFKHTPQGWTQVGEATLDDNGSTSFAVPAPKQKKRYAVKVPATKLHAGAGTRFLLSAPAP